MNSFNQLEPLCVWKLFETQLLPRPIFVVRFGPKTFFSCRNFLGGCQIEFNWDFRMSYRPWVSDNLKSTVKVGREDSMSTSDRKSKEAVKQWLSFCDKLIFQLFKFQRIWFVVLNLNWIFLDFSGLKLVLIPWLLLG